MGAVIIRDEFLPDAMKIFDEGRAEKGNAHHFRKFSKENEKNRFLLSKLLGAKRIATCFVALHKPSTQGTYIRDNHSNEYNYLLKMLVERVSWTVRDAKTVPGKANGPCALVLSEQRMYPYAEMFDYFAKLRAEPHNCSAEWNWIAAGEPTVVPHEDEQPIHLADIAASSFAMAIEPKQHKMTDDRFIRNLAQSIYQKHGRKFGLKLFPDKDTKQVTDALLKVL